MATASIDLVTETTAKAILEEERQRNAYLAVLAKDSIEAAITDYASIQRIVRAGLASKVFEVGDQINVSWTNEVSGTTYEWPFDVVHFDDVELADGETVPGMYLQAHYCSPFGVQFDQTEANYYCGEALPAGAYFFTVGTSWGSYFVPDTSYYFTTTVDIPAGGQIRVGAKSESTAWAGGDTAVSSWRVYTYESSSATDTLESGLELTEGTSGTSLGTAKTTDDYADSGINNLARAGFGYNRWSQSGIRQYLNSSAAIGEWWSSQNNYDRPPAQLATYPGFMSGFNDDFLAILKPVKVTTVLNTVSDDQIGTSEDTYDTFFLASLEQQFITPQLSGVEGDAWEYWKRVVGSTETVARQVTGAFPLTYSLNAKTTAQNVRLRSASRSHACNSWDVSSSGSVNNYYAYYAYRFVPCCVVC